MAIRKTGSRKIVVDGETYLWRICQKETLARSSWVPCVVVAIQHCDGTGTTLAARVTRPPPDDDNWLQPVLPSDVAFVIRQAMLSGWQPLVKGKQFEFDVVVSVSSGSNES